jgi:signal transduction histidine kinase
MPHPSPSKSLAVFLALLTACVAAMALVQSVRWYGHQFAGVLVTPEGIVSSIGMPSWNGLAQGLRFPDRIESVDGVPVVSPPGTHGYPGLTWDSVVDAASRRGAQSVHVRVSTEHGERELDLQIEPLDPTSWWLYAGMMIFSGGIYALAAVIAISSSTGGLARAFAKFSTLGSLYLFTFFEVHTTRTMVPLTYGVYACLPFALGELVLRLPDDVALLKRHPALLRLFDGAALTLALVVTLRGFLGIPPAILPSICSLLLGVALIASVAGLGLRFALATGTRRDTIGVLFRAMATPYLLVGLGVLVAHLSSRGSTTAFFAIPAMALAPVATAVAFVRHDLWGSRAILSRVLTRTVVGGVAGVLAIGLSAAFAASLGVSFRSALVSAALGAAFSAPLVYFAARTVERRFFPAVTEYKPTIEQLSEELTAITDPNEVGVAVERTVRRWLPCERVDFVAADSEAAIQAARAVSPEGDPEDQLNIPASFGGRTLGWLSVGRKRGGALFTTDDVDLLGTIANQAGLALAHAHIYAELEERRQQQAAAWQTERLALVETVAAEIAHEVRYPINFFRSVFRRESGNATLDAEEIDIGCEEVDRLERLVSGLRRMVSHRIDRRLVQVSDLAARAEMLLRDALHGRTLEVDIKGVSGLRCDNDQIVQVLVNLVANAIDAGGPRGHVGVTWRSDDEGAELTVWDDGPGFEADPSHLFSAWFTTKPRGTGLGLAITQRIVRAHGWGIDAIRVEGRTCFVVTIPSADVSVGEHETLPSSDNLPIHPRGDEHEDSDRR